MDLSVRRSRLPSRITLLGSRILPSQPHLSHLLHLRPLDTTTHQTAHPRQRHHFFGLAFFLFLIYERLGQIVFLLTTQHDYDLMTRDGDFSLQTCNVYIYCFLRLFGHEGR